MPDQVRGKPAALLVEDSFPGSAHPGTGYVLHLPHAPGGGERPSRQLSQVRHGIGAAHRHAGGRPQPGTDGHGPPLLGRSGPERPCLPHRHERDASRPAAARVHECPQLAATRPVRPGGPLVRLAVLRPRLDFRAQPHPQHVHAHRAGRRGRLPLQLDGHGRTPAFSRRLPRGRCGRDVFRHGRRGHGSRPARPDAGNPGARPDQRRHSQVTWTGAQDGPHGPPGRQGGGRTAGPGAAGRPPARPAGREGARGRGGR